MQTEFWASQGEVLVTEAVGFVLAGQPDSAAIVDSLTDYLKLLALLGQSNTPEQQLQLLRVSQGVLKQSAQIMLNSADFQSQLLQSLVQLLQVCTVLNCDLFRRQAMVHAMPIYCVLESSRTQGCINTLEPRTRSSCWFLI